MTHYIVKRELGTERIISVEIAPYQRPAPRSRYYNHGGTVKGVYCSVWGETKEEALKHLE